MGWVERWLERSDERFLIPGEHPVLTHAVREDGVMEVRYRDSYYAAPAGDCIVLPINNTSAENLSAWIGRQHKVPDWAVFQVPILVPGHSDSDAWVTFERGGV